MTLLNALGSDYESFVTTMMKPSIPSFDELLPMVQNHELRVNKNLVILKANRVKTQKFSSQGKGFAPNQSSDQKIKMLVLEIKKIYHKCLSNLWEKRSQNHHMLSKIQGISEAPKTFLTEKDDAINFNEWHMYSDATDHIVYDKVCWLV